MMKKIFGLLLGMLVLTGCSEQKQKTEETSWWQNDSLLQAQLAAAIEDAKVPDSSKVSTTLMPISKDVMGQEWATIDGRDMVLVMTLVDSSRLERFFSGEGTYRIDRELGTWVSIPAEWKLKRQCYEDLDSAAAHMRMIQMYGLSPDCDYNILVEFYADPAYMFRPAADPTITTTSAGTQFPKWANEQYKVGETNFREWYRYSLASAYEDDSPLPWTQLGYTYDWHEGADRQGLSEYIVTHQSLIHVKQSQSEWAFIKSLLK